MEQFSDATVQAIQDSVQTESIKIRDREFSTRPIFLPPDEKRISALRVCSLSAICEYLNGKTDGLDPTKLLIHVVSANQVIVYDQVESAEGQSRHSWLSAVAELQSFSFKTYRDTDSFIAEFQSLFLNAGDYSKVLSCVSNIVKTDEIEMGDDGVSQTVVVQESITKKRETIQNPVMLSPIRTFTEVDQPTSPFVLRIRKSGTSTVEVALFEADNGKWENEARQNIAKYLIENLEAKFVVLA